MRLSTVFELLLIFLFLALASSRHIEKKRLKKGVTKQSNINPYCSCNELQCNCCRDFPVVPIKGPGCASLGYKSGDSLQLTMSFGDRVLRNITLVGKRPKPVCMGLPGGISKFCGRLYNIERLNDQLKACLSLELRALDELEAALRVSCFNFGPKGVKLEPGAPLPSVSRPADEDDDDDDYDLEDDDDDDDDGDEFDDDDDEYNDVDTDGDYTGFAALSEGIFEGFFFPTAESSSGNKKKKPVRPVTEETLDIVPEVTTKSESVSSEEKDITTTQNPEVIQSSTVTSTTQRLVESTKGSSTTSKPVSSTTYTSTTLKTSTVPEKTIVSENTDSTEQTTDSPSTEVVTTTEDEKDNETEDSESEEEDVSEQKEEKENETAEVADRDEEDSNEGSADDEIDENDNDDLRTKQEDEEEGDEDDDEEEDSDEEEHESVEHDDSHETKDDDNILNVFFNGDEDSNETERERTRMEREKLQKILPGLMALLKPSPTPPSDISSSFAYPAVRSARVHRRMRLPPI